MRTHIILHTAAKRGDTSAAEIKRWHTSPDPNDPSKPWNDIGYHYVIRKDGLLETGRAEHVNGAHCSAGKMNRVSIGICVVGHGDFEEWTKAQEHTIRELIVKLCNQYKIPANNIKGHNEYDKGKTCPGKLIDMNKVREYFKLRLHETI
jgi:N-acetylmuramoyl-L-alanine amidase